MGANSRLGAYSNKYGNQSESEILSHLLELMLVVAREILDNRQIQE